MKFLTVTSGQATKCKNLILYIVLTFFAFGGAWLFASFSYLNIVTLGKVISVYCWYDVIDAELLSVDFTIVKRSIAGRGGSQVKSNYYDVNILYHYTVNGVGYNNNSYSPMFRVNSLLTEREGKAFVEEYYGQEGKAITVYYNLLDHGESYVVTGFSSRLAFNLFLILVPSIITGWTAFAGVKKNYATITKIRRSIINRWV